MRVSSTIVRSTVALLVCFLWASQPPGALGSSPRRGAAHQAHVRVYSRDDNPSAGSRQSGDIATSSGILAPTRLLVEYLPSPAFGIPNGRPPRFSWTCNHASRGQVQSAYRIVVTSLGASTPQWDSGFVTSAQTTQIEYPATAAPLTPGSTYQWYVQWADGAGNKSPASTLASFDLAPDVSKWPASWIGGSNGVNQLRTSFSLPPGVISRARLYICGLGYYRAQLNGQRVGDQVLGSFTTFQQRVEFDTHDVTATLRTGENVLAVTLGHGWYAQPSIKAGPLSLSAYVLVEVSGQTPTTYAVTNTGSSGAMWVSKAGPITADDIYLGESYDARLETPGWDSPGYNASDWSPAVAVAPPTGQLVPSVIPPIRVERQYQAVSLKQPQPGVWVFDFGQNMAGWTRIAINGPPGTVVKLQHSEEIDPSGNVVNMYSNSPMIDTYTLKGTGSDEIFQPTFTYHGFQYVQVTGFPGTPRMDAVSAFFIHTDVGQTGAISTSSTLLNQIQSATRMASLSNYYNIPTDCPQRERRGWLGDAQLSAEVTIHNWDMAAAYTKFLTDIQDQQSYQPKNGSVGDCVPFYGHGAEPADPAWGVAYTLLWNWMYDYYNDTRILNDHYDGVKLHLDSLIATVTPGNYTLPFSRYGDWCSVERNDTNCAYPSVLVSTFYLLMQLELFVDKAKILGKTDYAPYASLAANVRESFNSNFYSTSGTYYGQGYQTDNALPFVLGLVDPSEATKVQAYLINDIQAVRDNHLVVGIVGTKYIMPVLSDLGRGDVAQSLAVQTTYPSWGFMIGQGATTLWEQWGSTRYKSLGSKNHIMFGGQGAWYYQYLAGLKQKGGWSEINVQPDVVTDPSAPGALSSVSATIDTYRGAVSSAWTRDSGLLCATSPENGQLTLSCGEGVIGSVIFASFGTPSGTCGAFVANTSCNAASSADVISKACIGKSTCTVAATDTVFGDPCVGTVKRLYAQVGGCLAPVYQHQVSLPANTKGTVVIPRLDLDDLVVRESGTVIYSNGSYVPGVPGVSNAVAGSAGITVSVASGNYHFDLAGSPGQTHCYQAPLGTPVAASCPAGYVIGTVLHASLSTAPLAPLTRSQCDAHTVRRHTAPHCSYPSSRLVVEAACRGQRQCRLSNQLSQYASPEHEGICPSSREHPLVLHVVLSCLRQL